MTAWGGAFSIIAALCWAVAVILFKRSGELIEPMVLNHLKNSIALVLFGATGLLLGDDFLRSAPHRDIVTLLLSGVGGIAIADSLLLAGLNLLGVSRKAVVDCLYSPLVVVFAATILGERPSWSDLTGGLLIIGAVLLSAAQPQGSAPRAQLVRGITVSVLGMAVMALCIVIAKPLLAKYSVVGATTVRLLGGVLALAAVGVVRPRFGRAALSALRPSPVWRFAAPGAVLGTYVALFFWVAGYKYTDASVAALLNQTSTLFTLVLAWVVLREPLTTRQGIAVGVALGGSALVLL